MAHHPKTASADHEIHELIRERWSPRAFDPARDVTRDDLLRLFEAARWAPSSGNEQPWRFLVGDRQRSPERREALLGALIPKNQAWARHAPVLALVAVRLTHELNNRENPLAWYDAGQAVALLTVQATAQGLAIRQMAGFDKEQIRESCAMPEPFDPFVVMAIGYAGDPDSLEIDKHRESERSPRSRRPLGDFVFEGDWGTGIGGPGA
jgi:nitroreductase